MLAPYVVYSSVGLKIILEKGEIIPVGRIKNIEALA